MKIAVTITDAGMAINVGGPSESETAIIEIPDSQIPRILREHLEQRKRIRDRLEAGESRVPHLYQTVAFSLLSES
jgi:hypothetical protein